MSISDDQLEAWTNSPASSKAKHTYHEVKNALSKSEKLRIRDYEVYLQGSYANSTNIKIDSDIDIVVQLNSTFHPNTTKLSEFQKNLFDLTYPNATYHWSDFKLDVFSTLTSYFGLTRIKSGNKSIKLIDDNNLLSADIVPCLQHRNYNSFNLSDTKNYVEGIKFWTTNEFKEIINYPKIHIRHGEIKNASHRTNEKYKNMVRIIKNIRKKIIEEHSFDRKKAPPYFVECAIYNVPDTHFLGNYQSITESVLNFLLRQCNPDRLLTISHQHLLFGLEPWQWDATNAFSFFHSAENYYKQNYS